jgi:hypothetical protein
VIGDYGERVEDVGKLNPSGFRGEPKGRAIGVKGPAATSDFDDSFQVTVRDESVGDGTVIGPVDDVGDAFTVGLGRNQDDVGAG